MKTTLTTAESTALATAVEIVLGSLAGKPESRGKPLVRSLGRHRSKFDPCLLGAYLKLTAGAAS